MITFMDLGPRATVHLLLRVPVTMGGEGWTWGELPGYKGTLAAEYAYNAQECAALIRTYGRMIGRLLQSGTHPDRFKILARGCTTDFLLGMQEWQWAVETREFKPVGEYLCGWRDALRKYFATTSELPPEGTFRARTIAQSPCWVAQSPEQSRAAVAYTLVARAA